jgi:hypothetical protein
MRETNLQVGVMTSDKEMCKDFEDSGAVFPKVTPERIQELMKQVRYIPSLVEGTTTTLVVSVLPIGLTDFTLATTTMACVDKRNFNAELGVKYCIEKCEKETRNKLWELEGYTLAQFIQAGHYKSDNQKDDQLISLKDGLLIELNELQVKAKALSKFILSKLYDNLPEIERKALKEQLAHMQSYEVVLRARVSRICA